MKKSFVIQCFDVWGVQIKIQCCRWHNNSDRFDEIEILFAVFCTFLSVSFYYKTNWIIVEMLWIISCVYFVFQCDYTETGKRLPPTKKNHSKWLNRIEVVCVWKPDLVESNKLREREKAQQQSICFNKRWKKICTCFRYKLLNECWFLAATKVRSCWIKWDLFGSFVSLCVSFFRSKEDWLVFISACIDIWFMPIKYGDAYACWWNKRHWINDCVG